MPGPSERKDFADDVAQKINLGRPTGENSRSPDEKDPIKEIMDAQLSGERLAAFKRGAGIKDDHPPAKVDEKLGIDVAGILKAQNDLVTTALNTLSNRGETGQSEYMKHLEQELKELKAALSTPQDPLETLVKTSSKIDEFFESLKKRLGTPAGVNVAVSDMPLMLELEKIKIGSQERHDQWDKEMKLLERKWQREDQQWAADHSLKARESEDDERRKDKALKKVSALVDSVLGSIEASPGYEASAKPEPRAAQPEQRLLLRPKVVPCGCGAKMSVAPGATEVTCPSCGTVYDIMEASNVNEGYTQPPAPGQPSEVPQGAGA